MHPLSLPGVRAIVQSGARTRPIAFQGRILGLALLACLCLTTVGKAQAAPAVTIQHSFGDGTVANDGVVPSAGLVLGGDGNFYGTTQAGGTTASTGMPNPGYGVVFKITPADALTILHKFQDGTVAHDGAGPTASLVQGRDGNFYGTTLGGGSADYGVVFKITPAGAVTILHSFRDGTVADDGNTPLAALTLGTDGNFYGTTSSGGTTGAGTAFKITPAGALTILHSFGDGSVANDGAAPTAPLIQGTDGNLYGTTPEGGSAKNGVVFKMTTAGKVTLLHSFGDGTVNNDGILPLAGLIQSGGSFYGTTEEGGSVNQGVVFSITSAGALTILHSFSDGSVSNDGQKPTAALALGGDGSFYGTTTSGGGSADGGTVFKMTPLGIVTIVHSFLDRSVTNDGWYPSAGLAKAADGSFYGTTHYGGSTKAADPYHTGYGTVFQLAGLGTSPTWSARDVTADPNGTARLLWTRSDGAGGLWTMNASDAQSLIGPTYGPYVTSGKPWTVAALATAPDSTSRLLWTRSDGAAGLWTMNASDAMSAVGPTYGPYASNGKPLERP